MYIVPSETEIDERVIAFSQQHEDGQDPEYKTQQAVYRLIPGFIAEAPHAGFFPGKAAKDGGHQQEQRRERV